MDEPQPVSPRARLQALLAIPDRLRTDAQWDELNELEIMLASTNREGASQQSARSSNTPPGGHPKPGGGQHPGKRPGRKFHQRPPRRNAP